MPTVVPLGIYSYSTELVVLPAVCGRCIKEAFQKLPPVFSTLRDKQTCPQVLTLGGVRESAPGWRTSK